MLCEMLCAVCDACIPGTLIASASARKDCLQVVGKACAYKQTSRCNLRPIHFYV